MKQPTVAAVLSSYNRGKKVLPTINSLLKQTYKISKIILIDDGSEMARKIPRVKNSRVTNIYLPKNVGVVWGRNLGLSKCSKYDYVLLIDDDITLKASCVEELLSAFTKKTNCTAAMPVVSFLSKKSRVWSAGSGVNLLTGQTLFYTQKPKEDYSEIPAATSVLLAKVSAIKKSGWYDPVFYFCYEDADFYYRLTSVNKGAIYCVKESQAYHDIPLDLSIDRVARRAYHIARGRILFLSRHSKYFPLNILFVLAFGLYYSYVGFKHNMPKSGFNYMLGMLDGMRLVISGKNKLMDVVRYDSSLSQPKMHIPGLLRSVKVRV